MDADQTVPSFHYRSQTFGAATLPDFSAEPGHTLSNFKVLQSGQPEKTPKQSSQELVSPWLQQEGAMMNLGTLVPKEASISREDQSPSPSRLGSSSDEEPDRSSRWSDRNYLSTHPSPFGSLPTAATESVRQTFCMKLSFMVMLGCLTLCFVHFFSFSGMESLVVCAMVIAHRSSANQLSVCLKSKIHHRWWKTPVSSCQHVSLLRFGTQGGTR